MIGVGMLMGVQTVILVSKMETATFPARVIIMYVSCGQSQNTC